MNPNDQLYVDTVRDQIKKGTYDHLIGLGSVMLDIGANTGEVSEYFSHYYRRVVAIEPAPETFRELNNRHSEKIECYNFALAPVDAFVPFYVNDINFTASSTVNTYGKQIMVEGVKLSTLLHRLKLDHVDVCKCDAEGAEGESLSLEELDKAKDIIKCWFIEVHNCPKTTWEHKLGTLVGNLARCGYLKMKIDGMAITATK